MSDRSLDALFGELRALLAKDLTRDYMKAALLSLLEQARALDPARYDAQWLPYLEGNHARLPEVLGRFDSVESLAHVLGLLPPAARVGFGPKRQDAQRERATMLDVAQDPSCARISELYGWGLSLSADDIYEIVAAGEWSGLRRLDIPRACSDDASLARLSALPGFARVWLLGMHGQALTDAGISALASAPHAGALAGLSMGAVKVGQGVVDLVCSPRFKHLRWINLASTLTTPTGLATLARSGKLDGIEYLQLSNLSQFGDELALSLCAGGDALKRIGRLDLVSTGLTPAGLLALLESPLGQGIASLNVSSNPSLERELDVVLSAAPAGSHLSGLTYHGPLSKAGAERLAQAPSLMGLRRLELWSQELDLEQLKVLVQAPWFSQLEHLQLSSRGYDDDAAWRWLIAQPQLANLESLELYGVKLSDEVLMALAHSPTLKNLMHLDGVQREKLTRQVLHVWVDSPIFPLHLRQKFAAWL